MAKLTLNADPEVIKLAKHLAAEANTSVSALFSGFIRTLAKGPESSQTTRVFTPGGPPRLGAAYGRSQTSGVSEIPQTPDMWSSGADSRIRTSRTDLRPMCVGRVHDLRRDRLL